MTRAENHDNGKPGKSRRRKAMELTPGFRPGYACQAANCLLAQEIFMPSFARRIAVVLTISLTACQSDGTVAVDSPSSLAGPSSHG